MTSPTSPCVICLEPDVHIRGKLSTCKHVFCFYCICQWALNSNTCPLCKYKFRCISEFEVRTGSVLSKKRVGDKSQETESEFDELDISLDDISQLRSSIRDKYKQGIVANLNRSYSSDEDFSDFIVPDHFSVINITPVKRKILVQNEFLNDSIETIPDSPVSQVSTPESQKNDIRITSRYFTPKVEQKHTKRQENSQTEPRLRSKKQRAPKIDEAILENIRKYGKTGWLSSKPI